ncbi:MAG: hypothetical protein AAGG11_08125 [Pseudomonadota bacterium]
MVNDVRRKQLRILYANRPLTFGACTSVSLALAFMLAERVALEPLPAWLVVALGVMLWRLYGYLRSRGTSMGTCCW